MSVRPLLAALGLAALLGAPALAQPAGGARPAAPVDTTPDPVRDLVGRLDLERYKATIKGLTQFGDRRQGTKRNRDAVDWIEAQLKSYGCTPTERITYQYPAPAGSLPPRSARPSCSCSSAPWSPPVPAWPSPAGTAARSARSGWWWATASSVSC